MLAFTEYLTKPRGGRLALYGGFGALYGAAAMSLIRLGLRRADLIDKMVPQALTEWASEKLGAEPPGVPAGHPAADNLLHLVYSVTWGALAAPGLFATGPPSTPLDRRDVRSWALGDWPNVSVPISQDRSTGVEVFGDRESHGHRDPLDVWARRSGGDRRDSTPGGTWCLVRADAPPRSRRVGRHVAQTSRWRFRRSKRTALRSIHAGCARFEFSPDTMDPRAPKGRSTTPKPVSGARRV
jgi:hypothetical protein